MNGGAYLEVVFHMVNGCKLQFVEQEEGPAKEIIKSVNPQKFFTDQHALLLNDLSLTRISKEAISCVLFKTPAEINWPVPMYFERGEVLSQDEFRQCVTSELQEAKPTDVSGAKEQPTCFFLKLLTREGTWWHLRINAKKVTPVERAELARVIRQLAGFHAFRRQGGAVLFNMKNVIARTIYPPGPLQAPKELWSLAGPAD
jgi:hypothetical protein